MSSKDLLKLIEDSAAAVDVPSTPLQTDIDNPGDSVAHAATRSQKAHEASTKVQEVVALVARAAAFCHLASLRRTHSSPSST